MIKINLGASRPTAQEEEEAITQQVEGDEIYEQVSDPVYNTDPGFITLSIDDGPSSHTERLLEALAEKNARAIFFMIGENVKKHPAIVRRVLAEGHVIGNHSYTHPYFTKISVREQQDELDRTSSEIQDATGGYTPPYFRPPYGAFNESILLLATQRNMKTVMWSADPKDYIFNTESAVYQAADPLLSSRKILLLHDLKEATAEALPLIIDDIISKKLRVTLQYEM